MSVTRLGTTVNIATVAANFFTDEANHLIRLSNGHFAFAFVSGDVVASSEIQTLRTMTLDSFGGITASPLALQSNVTAYLSDVDLQASTGPNGEYFAIWNNEFDAPGGGPSGDGFGAVLSNASTLVSGPFGISNVNVSTDFEFAHTVTRLGDGRYLATWSDAHGSTLANLNLEVRAQIFSDTGARIGAEFTLNTTSANQQLVADSLRLTGGQEIVVWQVGTLIYDGEGNPQGIAANQIAGRFLDAGGTPLGSDITLATLPSGFTVDYGLVRVANISGGQFAMTWVESNVQDSSVPDTNKTFTIRMQIYDSSGNPVGSAVTVHQYTNIDATNDNEFVNGLELVELPNGNVVVHWHTFDQATLQSTNMIEAFDASGNVIVAETNLNTLPGFGNIGFVLSIEALPNNQLLVVGANQDGQGNIVYTSQIVDLGLSGFNILNGTPGADYPLYGTAANDYMSGMEGDDILIANEGDDTITGGDGNDILLGSFGIDTTYGGLGNDIHVTDSSSDIVVETAGQGTDSVYTTASFTLAEGLSIERLVASPLASTNTVNLTGNELGQVIVGNNGVNTINGGGGNDSIYGMGGNDYIEGAQGNDSLFGGTGVDRFIFRESLGTASGIDRIYDMTLVDNIVIDALAVSSLTSLTANQFRLGTAAGDADDRIIYDATSGVFWFDPDGTGAQAAILFGVINGAPGGVDHTWFELM